MNRRSVLVFVGVSFGVSWGVWLPLVAGVGLPPWYYYLGALGPALGAGAASVSEGGWRAVLSWAGLRLGRPGRASVWGVIVCGFALAVALAAGLESVVAGSLNAWAGLGRTAELPGWPPLAVAALLTASYGFCEELGWRGWLFFTWSRVWGPRKAALAVGGVWCLWHGPAFLCNPTYQAMGWASLGWAFSLIAGSVLLAWLVVEAGGSLWPVVAWHSLFDFLTVSDSSGTFLAPVLSMVVLALVPFVWPRLRRREPT